MENQIAQALHAPEAVTKVARPVASDMARSIAERFSLPIESVCRLLGTPPAEARRSHEQRPV
jgi:hypothetical protein